jgi:hypothetical protein
MVAKKVLRQAIILTSQAELRIIPSFAGREKAD